MISLIKTNVVGIPCYELKSGKKILLYFKTPTKMKQFAFIDIGFTTYATPDISSPELREIAKEYHCNKVEFVTDKFFENSFIGD